ncbi:MAG: class I SAM-dependent methyltransferase [Actinomycetota bacterium]
MSRTSKAVTSPVRRFFNPRFESLATRLDSIEAAVNRLAPLVPNSGAAAVAASAHEPSGADFDLAQVARQAERLASVDVSEHNREGIPPNFLQLTSQAASSAQCDDPKYLEWFRLLTGVTESELSPYNRKTWEWAYIAEAVTQAGLMKPGRTALGFGVGNEPLPALFVSRGLDVLATDQGAESGDHWASTGELMAGLSGLSRSHVVTDEELAAHVEIRNVDMNSVPADLGTFDVIWSSCAIEHLGSPEQGLNFVLDTCRLLAPGGIAVHTTELELTARDTTADYGNCAVYRLPDLQEFAKQLSEVNCTSSFNFTVPMDTPEDRWISLIGVEGDSAPPDIAHLKLAIGDSVSTSYGLLIRRLP